VSGTVPPPPPGPYGQQPYYPPQQQGYAPQHGYPAQQGYAPQHGYAQPPPGYYPPQGPPPRRGPNKVLLGILGGVLALVLVGLGVFFGVFYYSPVALRHVPPGTTLAVRVDLVDVATFAPVRRHLIPLVDEQTPGSTPKTGKSRSDRISDAVGVNLSRDLREVVVCFLGSDEKIVLIVGGNIPKGKLVPGLMKVQAEEGGSDFADAGGYLAAKRGGIFVGQASDGTAIVASDAASLQSALMETGEAARLGIPEGHAVAFGATGQLWKDVASSSFASVLESLQKLNKLDGLNGYLELSNAPRLTTHVAVTPGTNPEDAKASLYRVITDLRRASELRRKIAGSSQDFAGEEQALAQSGIDTKGNVVRVVTPWPYDGLDRGAGNLAAKVRKLRDGLSKLPEPAGGGLKLPGGIQLPIPGLP
jgi:hypothetical protein